jgi:hypothetical protein
MARERLVLFHAVVLFVFHDGYVVLPKPMKTSTQACGVMLRLRLEAQLEA